MPTMRMPLQTEMRTMRDWENRKLPSGFRVPRIAVPVFELGAVLSPAYGAGNQVLIVQHTVPANYEAVFCGIVLGYAGFPAANPTDILFSVDVDRPLGFTSMVGYDEKDYGSIPIQLGTFAPGIPWPVEFRHVSSEVIRIKGQTVANVGVGAPNYLLAALLGFEWPATKEQ
jgi:hypothetical protein